MMADDESVIVDVPLSLHFENESISRTHAVHRLVGEDYGRVERIKISLHTLGAGEQFL